MWHAVAAKPGHQIHYLLRTHDTKKKTIYVYSYLRFSDCSRSIETHLFPELAFAAKVELEQSSEYFF